MTRYYQPPIIENEDAYARATEARIKANRAKGGRKRWLAAFDDAQTLSDWLFSCGEFERKLEIDPRCTAEQDPYTERWYVIDHWEGGADDRRARCTCKTTHHPLTAYNDGQFLGSMREAIDNWGGLTEGQHNAVRKSFEKAKERLDGKTVLIAARKAEDAKSVHIGEVGERRQWLLVVSHVLSFEGQFGYTHFNICRDDVGNVVVYKGTQCWNKGEAVVCKATVKAHEFRDGVAQTLIARPKLG